MKRAESKPRGTPITRLLHEVNRLQGEKSTPMGFIALANEIERFHSHRNPHVAKALDNLNMSIRSTSQQ